MTKEIKGRLKKIERGKVWYMHIQYQHVKTYYRTILICTNTHILDMDIRERNAGMDMIKICYRQIGTCQKEMFVKYVTIKNTS